MPSHRSRPIGNADISGHRILASRSTIRQADSRDRPEPRTGGMESVPSISDPGRSRNVRTQFTPDDARRYYDRFGWRQDTQGFYENPAIDDLVKHADFEHARSVLEFGCGTGSFARRLLRLYTYFLGSGLQCPCFSCSNFFVKKSRCSPFVNAASKTLIARGFFRRFIARSARRIIRCHALDPICLATASNSSNRSCSAMT